MLFRLLIYVYVHLDLRHITQASTFIRYNPKRFSAAIWAHRKIGSTCLLFSSGKLVCTGSKSIEAGRKAIRQYARKIQRLGYDIKLKDVKIRTISAVHSLQGSIRPEDLVEYLGALYEPELLLAARVRRDGVHYTCFHSGKIIITGIKTMRMLEDDVLPILIELQFLAKTHINTNSMQ